MTNLSTIDLTQHFITVLFSFVSHTIEHSENRPANELVYNYTIVCIIELILCAICNVQCSRHVAIHVTATKPNVNQI